MRLHVLAAVLLLGISQPVRANHARQRRELDRLVQAALRHGALDVPWPSRWRRRLAAAAWLPRIHARVVSASDAWASFDPDRRHDLSSQSAVRWELRATWDLSRLVFDGRDLQVARTEQYLVEKRQQLIKRVIRLYYQRQALLTAHPREGPERVRWTVELGRITALLEALTGGVRSWE